MKKKIIFAKELYIGKSIQKKGKRKIRQIQAKLRRRSRFLFVYLIALKNEGIDPLEVIPCKFVLQKYYREFPPRVVGLAANQEEVYEMIAEITQDCILHTHSTDLRSYLETHFEH